jgi:hypothetical protein
LIIQGLLRIVEVFGVVLNAEMENDDNRVMIIGNLSLELADSQCMIIRILAAG